MCRHRGVVVRENCDPEKKMLLYRFEGNAPNVDYRVHSGSLNNGLKAVMERVFYVKEGDDFVEPPTPVPGATSRLRKFRTQLVKLNGTVQPQTYEQFSNNYSGRKRQLYESASATAETKPFHADEARLSSFIKTERFDYEEKPGAVPRLIQPRNPVYNARVGRFMKPFEHKLYDSIDKIFHQSGGQGSLLPFRTVMKGLNTRDVAAEIRAAWIVFKHPLAIFFDVSRFDQHVHKVMLAWEHGIYLNAVPEYFRAELDQLLKAQLTNKGFVRTPGGTIKYTRKGMRASGDMNTACGNVVIMCALMHAFMDGKCNYRFIDNGDDCVLIGEREEILAATEGIQAWFREMGFTLKIDGQTEIFERINFCQSRPVHTARGWNMVRSPLSLAKDLATTRDMSQPKLRAAWLSAVGSSGRALNDGVPISYAFYSQLPKVKVSAGLYEALPTTAGLFMLAKGMDDLGTPVTDDARISYYKAFGITPWEQEALEGDFSQLGNEITPHGLHNYAWPDDLKSR